MSAHQWHSKVLERVPNLTYRQLDYWVRTGVIEPAGMSPGSGVARRFSDEDVAVLNVVVRAASLGLHRETLRDVATEFRARPAARYAVIRPADAVRTQGQAWRGIVELTFTYPAESGLDAFMVLRLRS